jgi:putative ABC transport system permease protein
VTAAAPAGTRAFERSALRPGDALAVGVVGMRGRRGRSLLTALGIAIGIAAIVAVVGISASAQANVLAALDELGTNYLTIAPGQTIRGGDPELPDGAADRLSRIDEVEAVSTVALLDATVRRSDVTPATHTRGTAVHAASTDLLDTLNRQVAAGRWIDDAIGGLPTVVLGPTAARRHGGTATDGSQLVWLGERWFTVVGILEPLPLQRELNNAALVGEAVAADLFGYEGAPTTVYVRTDPDDIDAVREVAPHTASLFTPDEVEVQRPADALEARAAAQTAFTALLLGLGGVALLVGGVGIANVMVISVLERRNEIGVRRALGATRRHIRIQFLLEAVLQAGAGGLTGVVLGAAITVGYATNQAWPIALPVAGLAGGVIAALVIGGLAGLYPAGRAARIAPAEAVRTT